MPNYPENKSIARIIDANINRAKEGLRVTEEIARFLLDDRKLTAELKRIRHSIDKAVMKLPFGKAQLLGMRNSPEDVGRKAHAGEMKREGVRDIFFANMQRAKESIRVLEEFTKLINRGLALKFKKIRYDAYEAEKKLAKRLYVK